MIDQYEINIIVMLTQLIEKGKVSIISNNINKPMIICIKYFYALFFRLNAINIIQQLEKLLDMKI